MIRLGHLFAACCLLFFGSGCTGSMALNKDQKTIDLSSKSLALFTTAISNQNRPDYQPFPYMVFFGGSGSETFTVKESSPHRSEKGRSTEYLLGFDLKSGRYSLQKIWFDYHGTFIGARASVPLDLSFGITPNSVVYLGRITVVIRPITKDGETSAGGVFPIINQAVAGFSGATYDVTVEDRYEEDMIWFRTEYPALRTVAVEKAILPQWVRPRE